MLWIEEANQARALAQEQFQKSIPSRVFFNHFFAIQYHILADTARYDLRQLDFFNKLKVQNAGLDGDQCKKLLWNAWSTEHALRLALELDNPEYYRFSLHWSFPQAYYSVYLAMTAFHHSQGTDSDNHEKSIKVFGNAVKDGHYPAAISFFCQGLHEQFTFHGLSLFTAFPTAFNGLARIESLDMAHVQIAKFLASTRKRNAESKRERLEAQKDKKFLTKQGTFRKTFLAEHWNLIYPTIPHTSLMNALYRLRIKANYHDIESFLHAEIDFKGFCEALVAVVDYMNFVHEAYLMKVIGKTKYEAMLTSFPKSINGDTAMRRYHEHILPIGHWAY
jgi:hypothetical protein